MTEESRNRIQELRINTAHRYHSDNFAAVVHDKEIPKLLRAFIYQMYDKYSGMCYSTFAHKEGAKVLDVCKEAFQPMQYQNRTTGEYFTVYKANVYNRGVTTYFSVSERYYEMMDDSLIEVVVISDSAGYYKVVGFKDEHKWWFNPFVAAPLIVERAVREERLEGMDIGKLYGEMSNYFNDYGYDPIENYNWENEILNG